MSWRLDWYKADKENPLKIKIEDNGANENFEYAEINGELLLNSEGTEIWQDMTKEERNNKELFIELFEHNDFDYFEVTRKGLELFIEKYRQRISIVYKEAIKSIEDRIPGYPSVEDYHISKLIEWEKPLAYDLRDIMDKRPYEITTSYKYEYSIFNLIAIYKFFDFENYKLVIYGG